MDTADSAPPGPQPTALATAPKLPYKRRKLAGRTSVAGGVAARSKKVAEDIRVALSARWLLGELQGAQTPEHTDDNKIQLRLYRDSVSGDPTLKRPAHTTKIARKRAFPDCFVTKVVQHPR